MCVRPEKFVIFISLQGTHSKWPWAWEVISPSGEEHRGSWAAFLESFLNGDVAPLSVNFRKQIDCILFLLFLTCPRWLWAHFVPIYFCGVFLCGISLAGCSRTYWQTFDSNTFPRFIWKLVIRSNSYHCRKFLYNCRKFLSIGTFYKGVGISIRLIRCEEFFRFFTGSPIHPPLGIT